MSTYKEERPKVTVSSLKKMKMQGEKIAAITSYDYTMATLVDQAGADVILVGDSAANVMMGYDTTLPITLDEMITFAKGVVRGARHAMVVVDMPFGYYQGCPDVAVASAVRIMKETGAAAVKMEGGAEIRESLERILSAGIPVMGHLGLTPQSVNKFGGYGLRAKEDAEAELLMSNARMLQELGCFSVVLEKIPAALAKRVTESLDVPTIGIGAGADTDGQIIVLQDMLGLNRGFKPKFLRYFADGASMVLDGVGSYVKEVKDCGFPSPEESY